MVLQFCVDEGRETDVSYLHLYLVLDTVPPDTLVSKLERDGFDRWTTWWIRNCLVDCTQRVVTNTLMSKWTPVTRWAPQGSVLALALFKILFVSNKDSGLSAASAGLLMTLSCVVWLAHWREGIHPEGPGQA